MDNQQMQMPMFAQASAVATAGASPAPAAQSDWGDPSGGADFDVEMLAEYLLEDAMTFGANGGLTFDFKMDNGGSGVVSPENSEDGAQPPVADAAAYTPTPVVPAPVAPAPVPIAPTPIAPTPVTAPQAAPAPIPMAMFQPTLVAATGPAPSTTPAPSMPQAVQAAPAAGGMVCHQHAATAPQPAAPPANKRQRVNPPVTPANIAPVPAYAQMPVQTQQQAMTGMLVPAPPGHPGGHQMLATSQPHLQLMNNAAAAAAASLQLSGQQLAAAAAQAMQAQAAGARGGRRRSQAQIDRRRERNRILARRTRLRKKFFFEALQKEVMDLQKENAQLKEVVRNHLDKEQSKKILSECDAMEKMPPSVLEALGEVDGFDSKDFNLVRSIQGSQHAFIITDPSLPDNPIVFCSDDFCEVTGYNRDEVLGRNCRFLQGKDTCKQKLQQVRAAVKEGNDVSVTFVNYMADGTPFWNKLFIAALRDAQNHIVNFIGVLVKVAGPAPGDSEHGKTLPGEEVSTAPTEVQSGVTPQQQPDAAVSASALPTMSSLAPESK
uniref:LOV domain-containing protein n=1 Tax=Entomoneis paludosa TaxID=265537 RepID=A0A7S3DSD3_9STRA|mmetsp:Transcript_316/g.780  ORF Transcript_316/g.780 Transcript_316/m.780 type:complete len:548 (+) Transcript_316:277-1920(+)